MTNNKHPADAAQKKKRRSRLAAVAIALALAAGATAAITRGASEAQESAPPVVMSAQTLAPQVNIKNFGRVNENFYRGAQPDAEGFAELKKLGVKTVIDLREDKKRDAR